MGNVHKHEVEKLKARQREFDSMKNVQGFKRPGSMNPHKQGGYSRKSGKRR